MRFLLWQGWKAEALGHRTSEPRLYALGLLLFLLFSPVLAGIAWAAPLTADPAQGPVGASVTVTGTGWPPSGMIDFSWEFNYQATVARTQADSSGNFVTTVPVPQGAPVGPTYIDAGDQAAFVTVQTAFTITAGTATSGQTQQPSTSQTAFGDLDPLPAWYKNDPAVLIHRDESLGLTITWKYSYVFLAPGNNAYY